MADKNPEDAVLPEWISNLRPVGEVGPETYVLRRITQFVIGGIVGFAINIADLIAALFGTFESAFVYAGEQFGAALLPSSFLAGMVRIDFSLAYYARQITGGLEDLITATTSLLGPAGFPVLVLVLVGVFALLLRLLSSSADSIPVVASIKSFIGGS